MHDKYDYEEQIVSAFIESGEFEQYIDPMLTTEERMLEIEKLSLSDIPAEFVESWMQEYKRRRQDDFDDWMNSQREE